MAVAGKDVGRAEWESTLEELTTQHEGDYVTIEVLDLSLGDQLEVERLPFRYAAYDRRADTVVIAVGGTTGRYPVVLRHMVAQPVKLTIDAAADPPSALITDADGTSTLISFYRGD
jgi:hypothetical protein